MAVEVLHNGKRVGYVLMSTDLHAYAPPFRKPKDTLRVRALFTRSFPVTVSVVGKMIPEIRQMEKRGEL